MYKKRGCSIYGSIRDTSSLLRVFLFDCLPLAHTIRLRFLREPLSVDGILLLILVLDGLSSLPVDKFLQRGLMRALHSNLQSIYPLLLSVGSVGLKFIALLVRLELKARQPWEGNFSNLREIDFRWLGLGGDVVVDKGLQVTVQPKLHHSRTHTHHCGLVKALAAQQQRLVQLDVCIFAWQLLVASIAHLRVLTDAIQQNGARLTGALLTEQVATTPTADPNSEYNKK
jgi:hypothetical protein